MTPACLSSTQVDTYCCMALNPASGSRLVQTKKGSLITVCTGHFSTKYTFQWIIALTKLKNWPVHFIYLSGINTMTLYVFDLVFLFKTLELHSNYVTLTGISAVNAHFPVTNCYQFVPGVKPVTLKPGEVKNLLIYWQHLINNRGMWKIPTLKFSHIIRDVFMYQRSLFYSIKNNQWMKLEINGDKTTSFFLLTIN